MFSKIWTKKSTKNCCDDTDRSPKIPDESHRMKTALEEADTVIIGAGAGLSTAAGFIYSGERFQKYFADFIEKYGFRDMYSGGFYSFETLEEYWAYWSRYIFINRYLDAPKPVYRQLYELVKEKDYFVLTTNVDHQFQKAGFDKKRLFYTQGDFGLFQCSEPCHKKTYDNEAIIRQMMEQQKDMKIPSELVPRCPVCGKPMTMNLRADNTFVEDAGWHTASERYADFLRRHKKQNTLFLELGTGMNTPSIIKFSFWRMVHEWPHAIYACINLNEAYAPKEIQNNSICISADIGEVLNKLQIE
ncbi:MAG: Sir2 family NAD-dependent protein deacetylase [Eubacteriales bacterium]|nr:Sir2 family NAD-dependent protein deacetylase [Eubacteriales bacterium]